MKIFIYLFFILISFNSLAQKDVLDLGDSYADDQLYLSFSYAQFFNQPSVISKSGFSYGLSAGFLKDFILNKEGSFAFAFGVGYGYDFFNHNLKVQEINNSTIFSDGSSLEKNTFRSHNLEFPIEFRWRTSTAKKYKFWRVYTGVKFLYNLSNKYKYIENNISYSYKNINEYNKFQYGLTLSAGYNEFNFNVFYNLTPIFENAILNGEPIETSIVKFGLIYYIL